jgi:hypothetical protein
MLGVLMIICTALACYIIVSGRGVSYSSEIKSIVTLDPKPKEPLQGGIGPVVIEPTKQVTENVSSSIDNRVAFVITGNDVNFRSYPDIFDENNIITKLSKNTSGYIIQKLNITQRNPSTGSVSNLFEVEVNGQSGYVFGEYVLIHSNYSGDHPMNHDFEVSEANYFTINSSICRKGNLRALPRKNSKKVGDIYSNNRMIILRKSGQFETIRPYGQGEWLFVRNDDGTEGWIFSGILKGYNF